MGNKSSKSKKKDAEDRLPQKKTSKAPPPAAKSAGNVGNADWARSCVVIVHWLYMYMAYKDFESTKESEKLSR